MKPYHPLDTSGKPSLVLVDDNEADLGILTQALQDVLPACQIQSFSDGHRLLTSLSRLRPTPQLIVLDWRLPTLDGLALLTEIRRAVPLIHVPVILLSTVIDPDLQLKTLQLGGQGYYLKPDSFPQWLNLVQQWKTQFGLDTPIPEKA